MKQSPARHRHCELLAPAGSFDAGCAALAFGADAIYLGMSRLSARAEAVNFSIEELRSICAFAHSLSPRRSVHVAVNTLMRDAELSEATALLHEIADAGADAVIVQDLAVAAIAKKVAPSLHLHASTQLFIHNIEGARAALDLGFSRVVLARELSLQEIREITAGVDIETEVFIHGALCYGYSGQCLFSALATGRSGNRGQCAYCCRGRFSNSTGETVFPFSMRDLAARNLAVSLRDAGVASLKIEGRMKSAFYVAAATRLYRLILDGHSSPSELREAEDDLKTIFSRPVTSLYLNGRTTQPEDIIDSGTVGHRGCPIGRIETVSGNRRERSIVFTTSRTIDLHDGLQVDLPGRPFGFAVESIRLLPSGRKLFSAPVHSKVEIAIPRDAPHLQAGATVCCSSSQSAKRRLAFPFPRAADFSPEHPVDVTVALSSGKISATATLDGVTVEASIAANLDKAQHFDAVGDAIRRAFSRTGTTQWKFVNTKISNPDALFAPASLLNSLRRSLTDELDAQEKHASQDRFDAVSLEITDWLSQPIPISKSVPLGLSIEAAFDSPPRHFDCNEIILALTRQDCRNLSSLSEKFSLWRQCAPALRIALPLVVRNSDIEAVTTAILRLSAAGVTNWEVRELSMLHLLKRLCGNSISITAAASLYALNGGAARVLRMLGIDAAVIPSEADASDTGLLCTQSPEFFIVNAESRPALFVSETRPLIPGLDGRSEKPIVDTQGNRYTVEYTDELWVTRQCPPRSIKPPMAALRQRKDYRTLEMKSFSR